MGYDLGKATLLVLSVVAVVLAASLFPATGVGSHPGSGGPGGSGGGDGDVGGGNTSPPDGGTTAPETTTPEPTTTTTDDDETTTSDRTTTTPCPGTTTTGDRTPRNRTTTTDDATTGNRTTSAPCPDETTTSTTEQPATIDDPDDGDAAPSLGAVLLWLLGGGFLLVVVGGAAGVVGGVVTWTQDRHGLVIDIGGRSVAVGRLLDSLSGVTMTYVLGLAGAVGSLVDGLRRALSGGLAGLGTAVSGVGSAVLSAVAAVPRAGGLLFSGTFKAIGAGLVSFPRALGQIASGLGSLGSGDRPPQDVRGNTAGTGTDKSVDGDDDEKQPPQSVEEAWRAMVDRLPASDPRSRTPAEFARAAIDAGLPADPVRRLTALFREVRYGGRPEGPERTSAARDAYRQLDGEDDP